MTVRIENCTVEHETDKAILVAIPDVLDEKIWVPKSVVDDDSDIWDMTPEGSGPGDLVVATWFAEKNNLD